MSLSVLARVAFAFLVGLAGLASVCIAIGAIR